MLYYFTTRSQYIYYILTFISNNLVIRYFTNTIRRKMENPTKVIIEKLINTIKVTECKIVDFVVLWTCGLSLISRSLSLSNIFSMYGCHIIWYRFSKLGRLKWALIAIITNTGIEYLQYKDILGWVGTRGDVVVGTGSALMWLLSPWPQYPKK